MLQSLSNLPIYETIFQVQPGELIRINSKGAIERKRIHLSAVFINNFSNHLISIGQNLAEKNNIDPQLFSALIEETFAKLKELAGKWQQWATRVGVQPWPFKKKKD